MSIKKKNYLLTGDNLTIKGIRDIIDNPDRKIEIDPKRYDALERSYNFLSSEMTKKVIYGVNTGFGPMASHIIGFEEMTDLQYNLIRSHAVGVGEPISQRFVLAAMIVRLNSLVKGYSGVSRSLLDHLTCFINERIIPVVPEHGAVGTSGDLVQLAHIALALIGEGEVWYQGTRMKTARVLKKLHIVPYTLKPKEGLSLINGTSVMTGIAAILCDDARRALDLAIETGAYALELMHGFSDCIAEELHQTRPHPGQIAVAAKLRTILASSKLLNDRDAFQHTISVQKKEVKEIPDGVQEVYSFRCMPQILGPMIDMLAYIERVVGVEINSATDNPIVDAPHNKILHGGNFHGDYIAVSVDQLKIALVKLSLLSERRINFFLNKNVNKHLPPFLNLHTPGLTLGLQGLQFVATSTTAQSQSLAYPHSLHSISTNADNQDVVSMGTDAALITAKVLENAEILLTIEVITLLQATDVLDVRDKLSRSSQKLFTAARSIFPKIYNDRVIGEEFTALFAYLASARDSH